MTSIATSVVRSGVLAVAVLLSANAALAASKSLFYPPEATVVQFGASKGFTIDLPEEPHVAGGPAFSMNFVLPRDYKANEDVQIVLLMVADAPCTLRLVPFYLVRSIPGESVDVLSDHKNGVRGRRDVVFTETRVVVRHTFRIRPTIAFPSQRSGDGILLTLIRKVEHSSDTCPEVRVRHIEIRYPANP